MCPPIQCDVLVLGRDIDSGVSSNWKKIEVPYMNKGKYYMWGDPVSVQGRYLHWKIGYTNDLVSMDMVKEEVC